MSATNDPFDASDGAPMPTPESSADSVRDDATSTPVTAPDPNLEDAVRRSMDDLEIERTARQSTPPRATGETKATTARTAAP